MIHDQTTAQNGQAGPKTKVKGLPTYLVLDTSGSMMPFQDLLNDTLMDIYDTLSTSPVLSEFIHMSIISFNTRPHVISQMTDIEDVAGLPQVECQGLTNFAPMFALLREQIERDVPQLQAVGIQVLRPVVFVLTDGSPTDPGTWESALDNVLDKGWKSHPNTIAYGFGGAKEEVLARIATVAAYRAEPGNRDIAKALTTALTSLLNSLVASARAQQLQVPKEVEGYTTVPLDIID